MSLFSNEAYANFHDPYLNVIHKTKGNISPLSSVLKEHDLLREKRSGSADSTASTVSTSGTYSDFDPLSPRAASSTNSAPHPSLKVFAVETTDYWSDLLDFGQKGQTQAQLTRSKSTKLSDIPLNEEEETPVKSEPGRGGYQNYTAFRMDSSNPQYEDEDDDDAVNDKSRINITTSPAEPARTTGLSGLFARIASLNSKSMPKTTSTNATTTISTSLQPQEPPKPRNYDSYEVTFEKGPIGLELETDWYGRQAVVKGFKKINNQDGPAKSCGIIRIGDVLVSINRESCLELSFQETLNRLRKVGGGRHTLHFKSLEAAGDLSIYNQDINILQAKKFIHEHKEKFYKPTVAERNDLVYGCIERLRGPSVTSFNFHREDTGEFLLACSVVNECTGPFIFHTLQDGHLREFKDLPQSEDSAVYLGQMVPNFLGTEFTLVDHQQKRRNELGFLVYNRNVFGRIPNFLKVAFPREEEILSMSSNTSTTTSTMDTDQKPIIIDLLTDDQLLSRTPTRLQNTNHHRRRITTTNVGTTTSFFHQNTSLNGRISERFRLRQNTRDVPLVERLRNFSLDDLNLNFDGNVWQDADDHTAIAKAMRFKETRSRSQTLTPYGAIEQEEYADMIVFETKKPSWNEELGAWTLNFNGRVKVASKKNFLMVAENQNLAMEEEFGGEEKIYLRFGKVTKTRFTLDHQAPISPILALAIACSSFAHKIVVT